MSRKRPTESSWDSDDDLLRDDLPGITAFAKTKRDESEDEFDEDALLGSDDEGNNNRNKQDPPPVEISILNDTETFDNVESDISYAQDNHAETNADQGPEETFEIGVEDEDLAEFEGEDFEAEAAEIRKLGEAVRDVPPATVESKIDDTQTEDQSYHDDNETEDLNESEIKKADIDSDDDEEEDDDDDKSNRGRFKSERSANVVIKSSSISRTDIPDTLEITEEQQAQIDDFMDNQGKRKSQRGFRGRGQGQGRFPDRQSRHGQPQNQFQRFNRPPPPHQLQQGGHHQVPRHPYGPPTHGGYGPQQFQGYPNRHPHEGFPPVGSYPQSQGYHPHHGPQQHQHPPNHGPPQHHYEPQQHQHVPPQHQHVPPQHQPAPEEHQPLPPDHHIETEDIVPPDHHLPPDYALDGPPSPVSMDTQTSLSTASQPTPGTPRKVFVNPHFKPKGPPPTSLHVSSVQPALSTSQPQTSYIVSQMSWQPQQSPSISTSAASYHRPPVHHPQHYHDPITPAHSAAPPSLMTQPSYPPARPPYHSPQSLLGPGPHQLHQGALVYSGGPPPAHVRPLLQHRPQVVPQYHQNQHPRNAIPVNRFPQHHPQHSQPYQPVHQHGPQQGAVRPGHFHNERPPRPNFQGHGRGGGQGGPMHRTSNPCQIRPNVPERGQKRLSSSEPQLEVVPEKVAKPEEPPKPEEPVDDETRLLNEKIAEQKKLREKLIKQKEMKRRLAAAQKKKDLEKRLAEKGMTLADIGADSTESETDSTPKKQPEYQGPPKPQMMQQQQIFQQPQNQGGGNLRHPRPQMNQQMPNNTQQRMANPHPRPAHPQQRLPNPQTRPSNPQHLHQQSRHQQNQFHMRPPYQQGTRMDHPRHGPPHPMNKFPNQQDQHPQMRMQQPGPQGQRMQQPGHQGQRMHPPGPQNQRMHPPGPQGQRPHGFSSFNNPQNQQSPQFHGLRQNNPHGMRPRFQGEMGPNGDFNNPQNFSKPPGGPNRGRGGMNLRGNLMNRGRGQLASNSASGRGNLSNQLQGNVGPGNTNMRGGFAGRGNLGNFAHRGRGRGIVGNIGNQQQQKGNLQQVNIVDDISNDRQVILPENEAQRPTNRIISQQPTRIVTQKQQVANQMKRLATKSLAKATNIISLRKIKAGGQNDNNRVVVQTTTRTVIAQSKKSQLVCIDNLSASTTKQQLTHLCNNVGPVDSIQIDPCTKKALVKFQSAEHAILFSKKFNRHMIDLSHITVSLVPG